MIQLRDYQQGCSDALLNHMLEGKDGGLGVMATGTGKAFVLCDVIRRAIQDVQRDTRIVQLVHTKELIAQNYQSMIKIWPEAPAGIYSAGLGKKDANAQVIFGGIQSLYNKANQIGDVNITLVDECHTMSRNNNSMYGQFLSDLRARNPRMKLVGVSATPFRMKCGMLHKGDDAIFQEIVYDFGIGQAIEQGYLVAPRTKQTSLKLDVSGVGKRGGEFIAGQLEQAVDIDETTRSAISETIVYSKTHNLNSWIVFGAGIKHCQSIRDELRRQGISAEMVTSKTPDRERDLILKAIKEGRLTALVNMNVATTGFDAPNIDLVVSLRPTGSAGLWVQMVGRGSRLINPAIGNLPTTEERLEAIAQSSKPFFHVLDFAGNTARHGPIDMINAEDTRTGGMGEAPIKICEKCDEIVYAGVKICPNCGEEFPTSDLDITATASKDALLSHQQEPDWRPVNQVGFEDYISNAGKRSIKITYYCGYGDNFYEYISPQWARSRVWWYERSSNPVMPSSIEECLDQMDTLKLPSFIQVERQGKWWSVIGHNFEPADHTTTLLQPLEPKPENVVAISVFHDPDFDDEIPF